MFPFRDWETKGSQTNKIYPTFSDSHPDSISKANSSKVYFAKLYICKNISDVPFQIKKLREAKQRKFIPHSEGVPKL